MTWLTRRRAIFLGLAILLGLGIWWWRSNQAKQIKVDTYSVSRGDVQAVIVASGEVKAEKMASLRFPAAGKVAFVRVSEGDKVARGQALMGMDTADLAAAETAAFYRYQAADANAKQVEDSVKDHAADETFAQKNARVSAQTARDIAYDTWFAARRDTRDANLFSPLAGVVTSMTVSSVGASVSVTDGITVVDPASLYFSLEVDEADVGSLSQGQAVEISLDAYPDMVFKGLVGAIAFQSAVSDSGATVYPVRVKFAAEDMAKLRLGMNGDARVILNTATNVLTLPLEVVDDNQVTLPSGETKTVEVGLEGEDTIEITSGLAEGDQVIAP